MAARTQPASPATGGRKTPDLGAHPARERSAAAGKAARRQAPLESHRDFSPAASRDPIGLLLRQAESRVPELVPVRHGRMLVSPFAYYRGAALPMAADLAGTRSSGLRAQLCGDAHLLNFGAFASPERRLVFDLNDFDETLPGPFEWDVKRLVASMAVAGRGSGFTAKKRRGVAVATAAAYRTAMREFAAMSILDVWYARFDVEDALARLQSDLPKKAVRQTKAQMAKARTRDSTQALAKLTTVRDGQRQIISDPPLIVPIEELAGHLDVDAVLPVPPPPLHRVHADFAGRPAPAARAVHLDPRGPQGGWRRQRRHRGVDPANGTRRRLRAAAAAGQAGAALGAGRLRRPERIPQPGRACRRRPASDAGRQRHLPRLAERHPARPPLCRLLPPPVARLEIRRRDRSHERRRHDRLWPHVRLDPRPCSRPHRGPDRDRRLPRRVRQVRPGRGRIRRDLCRPDRTRPRGTGRRGCLAGGPSAWRRVCCSRARPTGWTAW